MADSPNSPRERLLDALIDALNNEGFGSLCCHQKLKTPELLLAELRTREASAVSAFVIAAGLPPAMFASTRIDAP